VLHIHDGRLVSQLPTPPGSPVDSGPKVASNFNSRPVLGRIIKNVLPLAQENLIRNKVKSVLTMLGVVIGVAAVLAMVTLGGFTRQRILETYETLGVNKLLIRGYRNWTISAADRSDVQFSGFNRE